MNNFQIFPAGEMRRVVFHVDADAFFASCEQALNPKFQGKPVVVGGERGIVCAASYEAKALGIKRPMRTVDAKRLCPSLIVRDTNFETYSLFSKRMFNIMRRYTGLVEEYGSDEGFMDMTGSSLLRNKTPKQVARELQQEIRKSLNITVSIGVASTKVVAKAASGMKKPYGLVCVLTDLERKQFLRNLPIDKIWGIGPNTARYMKNLEIYSAEEFKDKDWTWVKKNFSKPHQEIWHELHGFAVYRVIDEEKQRYASISKTRSFAPARGKGSRIYAELVKNLEGACKKARKHGLVSKNITIFLKQQNFKVVSVDLCLTEASAYPQELLKVIRPVFKQLYNPNQTYRTTGVVLNNLSEATSVQASLFGDRRVSEKLSSVYTAVDSISKKFGKKAVHLASSLNTYSKPQIKMAMPLPLVTARLR